MPNMKLLVKHTIKKKINRKITKQWFRIAVVPGMNKVPNYLRSDTIIDTHQIDVLSLSEP